MKKFNWGWGIALFYSGFVVFMLALVYTASQHKVDMVTEDYYKKELSYQQHIDKLNTTQKLKQQLQWTVNSQSVMLSFPAEVAHSNIKGEVVFYRPSNSAEDFTVPITVDSSGIVTVQSQKFKKGVYRMQIDWSAGDIAYYNEGIVNIN